MRRNSPASEKRRGQEAHNETNGKDAMVGSNPRIRGKIPHSEWPKIAERFANGESLTAIARSYECTAPAIRYIVKRSPTRNRDRILAAGEDRLGGTVNPQRSDATSGRESFVQPPLSAPLVGEFWQRVTGDIAIFLGAMDRFLSDESAANRLALIDAADQLLRVGARTRLALEQSAKIGKKPLRVLSSGR